MSEFIIQAKNIKKTFGGVKALKGVDFHLKKGEIRCLAGENGCGKSTLVKIISGSYKPDDNEHFITINGNSYSELNPGTAINEGIQVIYQDLSLFPYMSVADNIAINKIVHEKNIFVNNKSSYEIAKEQIDKLGIDIDLNSPVSTLSVANKQLVAICRALTQKAKVIFMDEPTTALTKKEIKRLLDIVLKLKSQGISIVFISHKLDEIFEISDNITVFRDGNKIGDFKADELDDKSLTFYMTGRNVGYPKYKKETNIKKEILKVNKLSKEGMYKDISFSLNEGDILGFIGLLGSGRTEIALSLFGLNKPDTGEIYIDNKKKVIKSPKDAINAGIALLPEDRLSQGLFLLESQRANITASILKKCTSKIGFINKNYEMNLSERLVNQIGVNSKNIELEVKKLSGGNQQKVVLAKWLAANPKILILDTPTVGVDIGSKSDIYEIIQKEVKKGLGVIILSDEIDEIIANCNKVAIVHEGRIIKKFSDEDLLKDNIKDRIHEIIINPKGVLK